MATFEQVRELVTTELRERVDRLVSAVEDDATDFEEISGLADAVGEIADMIAGIYNDIGETLMRGLQGAVASQREQAGPREQQDSEDDDDVTKEELLDRARDLDVEGRSSMTKDELRKALQNG